jgi:molecular chaperone GrpE
MLPVVDNLDRALASADITDEALKPILEGVELTRKTLVDALARHNVEQLNPVGEPFNPEYHEAMAMVPNPDAEPNSVMDVMQKGYTLNGRLLRAAMVVIAKAP